MLQVPHEASLIDRRERPDTHGTRGKLPQLRHQVGMRIGRKALPTGLAPEVVKIFFREPAFQERASIDAGRRVRLEEYQIRLARCPRFAGVSPEEMIEADFKKI